MLVLKHLLRTDYRDLVALTAVRAELRGALPLTRMQNCSTLCYGASRLGGTRLAVKRFCHRTSRPDR